jgi:hypothetical protein
MSISLITSRLEIFDNIKKFITIFEIRFLDEEAGLLKISLAKKSLEKSLINLAFDLQNKIENPTQISKKPAISSGVEIALEQLKDFGDKSLNQHLQELVDFAKNYENGFYQDFFQRNFLQKNHEDLEKLKSKILLIIAERFG